MILLNRSLFHVALLAGCSVFASTAHAQTLSAEDVAALKAEIATLRAQVQSLETRVEKAEGAATTATAAASAAASTAQSVQVAQKDAPVIKFKGAPEISDGKGWSFKPRGRFQFDVNSVNAPDAISDSGLGFSNEVRRAYIGFQGTIPGGFSYMTELNIGGDGKASFTDVYLAWQKGGFSVTAGQIKPFASLEEQGSDLNLSFLERAAFTSAFGFERRLGLSFGYGTGDVLVNAGVFTNNLNELSSADNSYSVDGRIVWMPKLGGTQLHFGASAHYHDLNDSASAVTYSVRPEAHSTNIKFIKTPAMSAVSETGYGLEAAAINGPFHFSGEGFWQKVGRPGLADPTFFGGYGEVGYVLTGEGRSYKGGTIGSIKPSKGVDQGGWGAFEVNLRYDFLDLNDAGIIGGKQDGFGVSLAWVPVDHVRLLADYLHLQYSDAAILAGSDNSYGVDTLGMRFQLDF